jgi:hypothetical protein
MQSFDWLIEDIVVGHPDLYLEHCAVMAVAMMSRQSVALCEFLVECEGFSPPALAGETCFVLAVRWTERTAIAAQRIWLTEQSNPIIERAAVALAALAFTHMIANGQMRVTQQGDRSDYWLPRLGLALEISGTTRRDEMTSRHREKKSQMLGNPRRWNGYVLVCCFSPDHRVIRWSFHSQEK